MTDTTRARLLVSVALAGAAIGLLIAAIQPGPESAASTPPGFGPGPVTPSTPVTPAWAGSAAIEPGIVPDSDDPCRAGSVACLDAVVGEMEARLDQRPCAHTSPFAFTYLETTRDVRRRVAQPDFFVNSPVISQLDAIFATLYFDAFDNWTAGRSDEVPGAWRIAFQAADEGQTSAAADVFLGMNAHISRDLAYAVARVARAEPGMLEDPTDYLLVNEIIADVQGPMLADAADRFDPRLAGLTSLLPAGAGVSSVELIAQWRDQSLDLGSRLASAESDEERVAVAAEIERNAVAGAVMILNADASLAVDGPPFDRDEYCESNREPAS
jgi:hypothetical protein